MLDHVVVQRHGADPEIGGGVLLELRAELLGDQVHLRLRLRERHPRRQSAEHGEERQIPRQRLAVVELDRRPEIAVGHLKRLGGKLKT